MWDTYPTFRRSQRVITAVWAVVLLLEAVVKAIAIRLSDYQDRVRLGPDTPGRGLRHRARVDHLDREALPSRGDATTRRGPARKPNRKVKRVSAIADPCGDAAGTPPARFRSRIG